MGINQPVPQPAEPSVPSQPTKSSSKSKTRSTPISVEQVDEPPEDPSGGDESTCRDLTQAMWYDFLILRTTKRNITMVRKCLIDERMVNKVQI